MKINYLFLALTLSCLFSFGSERADACSCIPLSTCRAADTDAIFIGKVEKAKIEKGTGFHQVKIIEKFSGAQNEEIADIRTDYVTSCAFMMEEGETYLIFANKLKTGNQYTSEFCSGTKKIKDAETDLRFLRGRVNSHDSSGVLTGEILEYDVKNKFDVEPWKPKEVNKVFLEAESGEKFESLIQADGKYSFKNLKFGNYKVSINLPSSLIASEELEDSDLVAFKDRSVERRVKISAFICEVKRHFALQVNGIISGKVIDANGSPVKNNGLVLFRLEDSENSRRIEGNNKVWTKEDGTYSFKGLPPGRYILGSATDNSLYIESDFAAYLPIYFPATAKREEAEILKLGDSEILTERNLKLLPKIKKRKVSGQVIWADGRPAPQADIVFYARRRIASDETEGGYSINIDDQGRFTYEAYEQTEYFILARIFNTSDLETRKITYSSPCYAISENEIVSPLKIVLKVGKGNCNVSKFKGK